MDDTALLDSRMNELAHTAEAGESCAAAAIPEAAPAAEDGGLARNGAAESHGGNFAETRAAPHEPRVPLTQVVEALLFACDAPLSPGRIAEIADCRSTREVRAAVAELNARYEAAGLTFRIEEIAGGFRMLTLPALHPWLAKLNQKRAETRLSDAAMETLAIIAYKQPIMRADIEAIRGVAAGETISRLRELGLVKVVGRAEIVGRPQLLGTTRKFLDMFGLASPDELPPLETFSLKLQARPASETPAEAPLRAAAGA